MSKERKEFQMTEEQLEVLLKACQPVPYMVIGGVQPLSRQENANAAWERLGREMGFDHMTARQVPGRGMRYFSAVPTKDPSP